MPKIKDLHPLWQRNILFARIICFIFIMIYPVWIFVAIWQTLKKEIKEVCRDYWDEATDGSFGKYE